jgi:hypothetical protein
MRYYLVAVASARTQSLLSIKADWCAAWHCCENTHSQMHCVLCVIVPKELSDELVRHFVLCSWFRGGH